jgi:uncharacterized membrane protein/uncharacterized membrane-anchored protein
MKTDSSKLRWLHAQLPEWEKHGLIGAENAAKLREFYPVAASGDRPLVQIILGCFGALLIVTGVILLLAHNWEELARPVRALIALGCLGGGQLAVGWTLLRKHRSATWREGSAALLGMGVAACIALIGQTYHLPGNLESFLLVWAFLILPLPYLLRSGFAFLLLQIVLTTWAVHAGPAVETLLIYGGCLAVSFPYLWVVAGSRQGTLLRWLVALALCVTLGATVPQGFSGSWILLYGFFFPLLVLLSPITTVWGYGWRRFPFAAVGDMGLFVLAALLTISSIWPGRYGGFAELKGYWDLTLIGLFAVALLALLIVRRQNKALFFVRGAAGFAILTGFFLAWGGDPWAAAMLMNLLVFALAAAQMRQGYLERRISLFNVGFLQFSVLLLMRFFDADLGTLPRAGIFIVIGAAFLLINSSLSRRLRSQERKVQSQPEIEESGKALAGLCAGIGERLQVLGSRRVTLGGLAVVILIQLAVPGKMMLDRELALRTGENFRFATAPIDPYDPFRGRYVALAFSTTQEPREPDGEDLGKKAFAKIETDERGYSHVTSLHAKRPSEGDYLQVSVSRRFDGRYRVTLPFNRYYMNEHAAPEAERIYLQETRRRMAEAGEPAESYALVRVRRGIAVMEGLYLEGVPIEDHVRATR